MPSVVFANNKGGSGKTTLALSVAIAAADAGLDVLLVDLSRFGDASRAILGGHREGEKKLRSIPIDKTAAGVLQAIRGKRTWLQYLTWQPKPGPPTLASACEVGSSGIKVIAGTERLSTLNDFSEDDFKNAADQFRALITMHKGPIILDTDHDIARTWYGRLGLAVADEIVLPVSANESDAGRLFYQEDSLVTALQSLGAKCSAKIRRVIINGAINSSYDGSATIELKNGEGLKTQIDFGMSKASRDDAKCVLEHLGEHIPTDRLTKDAKVIGVPLLPSSVQNSLQKAKTLEDCFSDARLRELVENIAKDVLNFKKKNDDCKV